MYQFLESWTNRCWNGVCIVLRFVHGEEANVPIEVCYDRRARSAPFYRIADVSTNISPHLSSKKVATTNIFEEAQRAVTSYNAWENERRKDADWGDLETKIQKTFRRFNVVNGYDE